MLEVKNLTKIFKDTVAVNDVSFKIEPGKIFGLLGPNGAGKTTTIRTVLNIIKPSSGTILFDGEPITKSFFNITGYLPEERGLYKKGKVNNTILYFAQLKGMDRSNAQKETDSWLNKFDIANYGNKRIEELSKGNQQKIQFISAVIHRPRLIILDEPFTGFDPINQQLIKELLLSLMMAGKIIMLSTHQMETAEKLCSDIMLINNGKTVCSGNLSQIKKNYGSNFVKIEFKGDPAVIVSHNSILHIDIYTNYAEIQLKEDALPYEFLRDISGKINVTHFSIVEPTLNKIFIDSIKQSSN